MGANVFVWEKSGGKNPRKNDFLPLKMYGKILKSKGVVHDFFLFFFFSFRMHLYGLVVVSVVLLVG